MNWRQSSLTQPIKSTRSLVRGCWNLYTYRAILVYELQKRGLRVRSRDPVPIVWDEVKLDIGFEADIIVEDRLVLELKAIEAVARVHRRQLLTYLKLTNCRLGLLINFGEDLIKDGISRVVNGLKD